MKHTPFGCAPTELSIRMDSATSANLTLGASSSLPVLGPNDVAAGDTHADMVTPSSSPSQINAKSWTKRFRMALVFWAGLGLGVAAGYHARVHIEALTESRMDALAEGGRDETARHLDTLLKIREVFGETARQSIQAKVIDEKGKKINIKNLERKMRSVEQEIAQILASVEYLKRKNIQLDAEELSLCLDDLENLKKLMDQLIETVKRVDDRSQDKEVAAMTNTMGVQLERVRAGLSYLSSQVRSLLPEER